MDRNELVRQLVERRIRELQNEIAALTPLLSTGEGKRRKGNGDPQKREKAPDTEPRGARRRGRKMSAAQRKAVGERMRTYWAKKRKAKS